MTVTETKSRGQRRDIQGLRAIAVVSVVLYHANPAWAPGGFAGVDMFFVISGYLITGILLSEMDRGVYSLTGFYERRVRRLFPALYLMLAAVLLVAAFTLSPAAYKELANTALATIFFVSNVALKNLSGYFDQDAHFRPLLHTWSLAVEEQFYLLFPPALFVAVRFARKHVRWILGAAAILSLSLCVWELPHNPTTAFYLAPFRGYELLIGALIAGLPFPQRLGFMRHALSLAGLAAIALSLFALNDEVLFPGLAALLPCVGAALVLFSGVETPSVGGRLISSGPFQYFGNLSYSLYLWHWPILVLGESILLHTPTTLQSIALVALAVLAASLSWRFVEQPFLQRGRKLRVLAFGAAAIAGGAVLLLPIIISNGAPERFPATALRLFATKEDYSPYRWACHDFLQGKERAYAQHCVLGDTAATPHVAMWADSHGVELAEALAERLAVNRQSIVQLTASGCPPSLDYVRAAQPGCAAHNTFILNNLASDARIGTVLIDTNLLSYPQTDWARITAGEERAVEILAQHGKHIVLLGPIPRFDYDVPTALGVLRAYGVSLTRYIVPSASFALQSQTDRDFVDHTATLLHINAFEPSALLCDSSACEAYQAGVGPLYFNRDHLSESAARMIMAHFPLSWLSTSRARVVGAH